VRVRGVWAQTNGRTSINHNPSVRLDTHSRDARRCTSIIIISSFITSSSTTRPIILFSSTTLIFLFLVLSRYTHLTLFRLLSLSWGSLQLAACCLVLGILNLVVSWILDQRSSTDDHNAWRESSVRIPFFLWSVSLHLFPHHRYVESAFPPLPSNWSHYHCNNSPWLSKTRFPASLQIRQSVALVTDLEPCRRRA
jgi:hypothetical protein